MQLSKMKNIIVLRGMASNVVDEAIVVLKPNVKLRQSEYNTKSKAKMEDITKKMVVKKEAENTINQYVTKLEKESKKVENEKLKMKYKFLQVCNGILILTILVSVLFMV